MAKYFGLCRYSNSLPSSQAKCSTVWMCTTYYTLLKGDLKRLDTSELILNMFCILAYLTYVYAQDQLASEL